MATARSKRWLEDFLVARAWRRKVPCRPRRIKRVEKEEEEYEDEVMKSILAFSLIFGVLFLRALVIGKRSCLSSRRTAEDKEDTYRAWSSMFRVRRRVAALLASRSTASVPCLSDQFKSPRPLSISKKTKTIRNTLPAPLFSKTRLQCSGDSQTTCEAILTPIPC